MQPEPEPLAEPRWSMLLPEALPVGDAGVTVGGLRSLATSPFAPERVGALSQFSAALLRHAELRRDPAAAALGFWLRGAHLAKLKTDFQTRGVRGKCVPAGLVFHVAPANVDTMFLFSWALSFLAGNANIVRLTSERSGLMEALLRCLGESYREAPEAFAGNWFVSYGHDDAVNALFSRHCDQRIVWGGDETVRRLRAVPLNPHAGERAFASKRSLCVISVEGYAQASLEERGKLADRLAQDLLPFDQMACSSPHVVYWVGGDAEDLRSDLQARLESAMAGRRGEGELSSAVKRLNFAFQAGAAGRVQSIRHSPHSTHLWTVEAGLAGEGETCGSGLLIHAGVRAVDDLAAGLQRDHQTITYFGLSDLERECLAEIAGRAGVDRIVPVGRALDFGPIWDGYDLWSDLVRYVTVE